MDLSKINTQEKILTTINQYNLLMINAKEVGELLLNESARMLLEYPFTEKQKQVKYKDFALFLQYYNREENQENLVIPYTSMGTIIRPAIDSYNGNNNRFVFNLIENEEGFNVIHNNAFSNDVVVPSNHFNILNTIVSRNGVEFFIFNGRDFYYESEYDEILWIPLSLITLYTQEDKEQFHKELEKYIQSVIKTMIDIPLSQTIDYVETLKIENEKKQQQAQLENELQSLAILIKKYPNNELVKQYLNK